MKRMTRSPERSYRASAAAWLVGAALASSLAVPACSSSKTPAANGCSLNSDCSMGLICALGICRGECVTAADCATGGSCIDDGRYPVCQPAAEKNTPCTHQADCPTPLACASDYRCRNLCESDADCNVLGIKGRACAEDTNGVRYCADPGESANGVLITKPPPGAPSTPVVEPEGGAGAIVAALPSGVLIATSVGPAGGVVGIDGVTVTIPANALSATLTLTIQRSGQTGPNGTIGEVFEIGPTGTTFSAPVTIAFDYTDSEVAGLAPSDFAVETIGSDSGLGWTPLSQIVVDVYAHTIAGQTTHLSPYALVQQGVTMGTIGDASAAGSDSGSGGGGEGGIVSGGDGGSSIDDGSSSGPPAIDGGSLPADAGVVLPADAGVVLPADASVRLLDAAL